MSLRGVTPSVFKPRFKAMFYGGAGVGKTMAAISFPAPYIIDTEGSTDKEQYVEIIENNNGSVFMATSFDEILKEVIALANEEHHYKTLVIDSLTVVYSALVLWAEKTHGTDFGKHFVEANKLMQKLLNLLFRLDMNVIITAHSKNEYGHNMVVLNQTFDCYKKLDFLFDLVFEVQARGRERVGVIKKSRILGFDQNTTIPFSYGAIAEIYGQDILERKPKIQPLATTEQVKEINMLLARDNVPYDLGQKWLDKADIESFELMKAEQIDACINFLKTKFN